MSSYLLDQSTPAGNRGSHYNSGSEFLFYVNELDGKIWRQPVNPVTMIMQQVPQTITSNQTRNLNGTGGVDIKWSGSVIQGQNNAKVYQFASQTTLDQVSPSDLTSVDWGTISPGNSIPEAGTSTAGVCYAVRIPFGTDFHYAKFRIFKDGANTKVEWISYIVSTKPMLLHQIPLEYYPAPRDIVVSPYESDLYVSGGDPGNGYVLQIPRVVGGAFPQYSNNPAQINADALDNPQQMIIDGSTVYVVAGDGLFFIDMLTGYRSQVVNGITTPIGLLLDDQGTAKIAYISDAAGNVYAVDISTFSPPAFNSDGTITGQSTSIIEASAPSTALGLGGSSGYLTWADADHSAFYAAVTSSGEVKRVDLVANTVTTEATVGATPWSVEVFDEYSLTVVCDAEIGDISRGVPVTGDFLMGIGLIPFQYITNSVANPATPLPDDGKADTSQAPGYYFSAYPNLPFAGSLSLLINHTVAWNSLARYFRLSLINVVTGQTRAITTTFVDLRWNAAAVPPRWEPVSVAVQDGLYPVRNPSDLWYNAYLAAIINTVFTDNGHNRLKVEFYDAAKQLLANNSTHLRLIFIDNTAPKVQLFDVRRGSDTVDPAADEYQSVDQCGVFVYDTKNDRIAVDMTASRADGLGSYKLSFARGSTGLFSITGNVTVTPTLIAHNERSPGVVLRIGHLTGNCDIANVTISLSVLSRAINGYGWVNLGAYTARSFTLAKSPLTHTNWP